MTLQQSIPDVKAYSMAEFFTSTYKVPKYQRNYTWGEEEVAQLLKDLIEYSKSGEPFYLLGDVIAAHSDDADFRYELVDGQQRTTTLCLLFLCLYKKLNLLGFGAFETNQVLNAFHVNKGRLRILMSGQASEFVLSYLENEDLNGLEHKTVSQKNVAEAITVINKSLSEAFDGASRMEVLEFSDRLLQTVYFGRLTLGSVDQATAFFERVNNRGVRLSTADLLKNRILQNIGKEEDYEAAAAIWGAAEQTLMSRGKLGSVEYLLRHLRQAEDGEKIIEGDLFKKTEKHVASESGCLQLVEKIDKTYPVLAHILDGKTPSGQSDFHTHGTRFFGFNQHFGVRLAAGHLSEAAYLHASKRLEARSILSLLAGERPSAFEKEVPRWEKALAELLRSASPQEVDDALNFDARQLSDLFHLSRTQHENYRYDGTPGQQKRIRYVLAKANHIVGSSGPVVTFSLAEYLSTTKATKKTLLPGFDIDHVHPKSIATEDFEVHSIGNLTLLHAADNQEKGSSEPNLAATLYGHSKCYLTKSLTDFPQTAQVEAVIAKYRVASADGNIPWGKEQVEARSKMYFAIVAGSLMSDLGMHETFEEIFPTF